MSPETFAWVLTAHVLGIITWVGAMLSCALAIRQGASAEKPARADLAALAKRLAMAMDAGAAIAIVAGLTLIYGLAEADASPLKHPWMHVKLTLVVVGLLGSHALLRIRVKRLARGDSSGLPPFLFPALHAIVIGILIMAIVKPF
jgi:uncharacterized membrane protein